MSTKNDRYDLVVFGASGFTGQFVVEEVAKTAKREADGGFANLSWAVAGRNEAKLRESIDSAQLVTGLDLSDVGLIIADIKEESSIDNMTKQANVILNCVGPYLLYGRPIVESCIKNGANQVDLSGEPQYVDGMKLDFDEAAETAGVHLVSCCGMDSIPADVGLCHLGKNFPGRLNSAKGFSYVTGKLASLHTGTMQSILLAMSNPSEMLSQQKQLYPTKLPKPHYSAGRYFRYHHNSDVSMWGMPFPCDEGIVYRTQRYMFENTDLPFVQYQGFVGSKSLLPLITLLLGAIYLYCMSFLSCTRNLLSTFPEFMTAGMFSNSGPSREELIKTGFCFTIVGEGWKEKLPNKEDEYPHPPNHKMILDIFGPDPAYRGTSIILVACAMTILREKANLTQRGGVTSPGMTFANTTIVERLTEGGLFFNMREA